MRSEQKKTCNKCLDSKPLDEFSPHPKGKFGRQGQCRDCRNEYFRERHRLRNERAIANLFSDS